MDNFNVGSPEPDPRDLPTIIDEACRSLQEDVKPLSVSLTGTYDFPNNTVLISGRAYNNDEINRKYLNLFFDILYYLPIDTKGKRYRFELITYSDFALRNEKHKYVIETSMEKLPGTAHITRQAWNAFATQLKASKDGSPLVIPAPEPFVDDPPLRFKRK